jgi:hypothetical protein
LEFEIKWKGFENCTKKPGKLFERGGVRILDDFLETKLVDKRDGLNKNKDFEIRKDKEVDRR